MLINSLKSNIIAVYFTEKVCSSVRNEFESDLIICFVGNMPTLFHPRWVNSLQYHFNEKKIRTKFSTKFR